MKQKNGSFAVLASSIAGLIATLIAGCGGPAEDGRTDITTDEVSGVVMGHGRVRCVNSIGGAAVDLAHVTVKLMNSNSDLDTVSDEEMGVSFTQNDGTFTVGGFGGDLAPEPWSGPDVYVRVVFDDSEFRASVGDSERVSVIDEIYRVNVFDTPRHDHNNTTPGTVEFGDITLGLDQDWSCGNFMHALQVFEEYRAERGGEDPPPGAIQVQRYAAPTSDGVPWADRHYIHWFTRDPSSLVRIRHEFGHTIRHHLDGEDAHFLYDATRFRYARSEGHNPCSITEPGFAFNEGWAEYWAQGNTCGHIGNWSREGDVTMALRQLESCSSRSAMVQVLIDGGWDAMHSYPEFEQRFLDAHPECDTVFDADFYLHHNLDLLSAYGEDHAAARDHWLNFGIAEGRRASREFDVKFYLDRNPDLRAAFGTDYAAAIDHWRHSGLPIEGRRGSREFDVQFYLGNYGDLSTAFSMPPSTRFFKAAKHWRSIGLPVEGRRGSRELDAPYYLYRHADLKSAFGMNYPAAIDHFIEHGLGEGRRGSRDFDVSFYLANNSDLQVAFGMNLFAAFDHWVSNGRAEGRQGAPANGIPLGDIIIIRAAANLRFVTAENGGASPLIANRTAIGGWELFRVEDRGNGNVALKAGANERYVCADVAGTSPLIANRTAVGGWETFAWIDRGNHDFALRAAANGKVVTAENGGASSLIANRDNILGWETFSWSSF